MNQSKKRSVLLALAALPLTAGLVFAAGTSSTAPQRVQPAPPGQTRGQGRTHYADVFLQNLAARLGISVDRLRAAAASAANATIDQAVRAGDIPQDRAAELKARARNAPLNFGLGAGLGVGAPAVGPGGWANAAHARAPARP